MKEISSLKKRSIVSKQITIHALELTSLVPSDYFILDGLIVLTGLGGYHIKQLRFGQSCDLTGSLIEFSYFHRMLRNLDPNSKYRNIKTNLRYGQCVYNMNIESNQSF